MALILLAEDESSTIDHVRSVLASQGWLVKTVKSRAQALRAASEFAPQLVLLNDQLKGVDDLVRTFSRRSGGPGVVLLSAKEDSSSDGEDVEAVLTKPVQTEDLIATIRDKLSDTAGKKASTDAGTDVRILSTEEIFGDLLDDILDKEEPQQAAAAEKDPDEEQEAAAPDEEPVEEEALADDEVSLHEEQDEVEPEELEPKEALEEAATVKEPAAEVDDLADFSDLEELAKETVPALVDAVEAQARQEGEPGENLDVAELLRETAPPPTPEKPEPEPTDEDLDDDLEAKLSDTLAGVFAASLGAATEPEGAPTEDAAVEDVDNLLSAALSELDIGGAVVEKESPTSLPEDEAEAEPVAEEVEEPEPEAAAIFAAEQETPEEIVEEAVEEAPQPEPPAKPVIEFGEFTLEERIGIGGMAEVWKARRQGVEGFEKRVAVKKILPQPAENQDFVDMFIDEAKLAAQLNHPHITHIYDLGKVDDDYFIAMEYVEGQNLRHLLDAGRKKEKPLPAGLALFVVSRIADALDYAHRSKDFNNTELGLVHRDVSPHNVLISYEGEIKLCDFGIAKAVSKISTTQMGALKGKIQYMSPEQAWGRSIDHRSDIFSAGTLLYEMLTGERLFTGESELSVLEAVRECETAERVIQDPAIPARVKGPLLKALAKDPEERFETAGELLEGLEELLAEFDPTPGQREMSNYVRELLDLPEEEDTVQEEEPEIEAAEITAAEPIDEETEQEVTGAAAILLAEPPEDLEGGSVEVADEEEVAKPAILKWLSRLLPIVAVAAIGGYLIVGRMDFAPDAQAPATASSQTVPQTQVFRPEAVEADLFAQADDTDAAEAVPQTAQAAPPVAVQEQRTTPPPSQATVPEEPVAQVPEEATTVDEGEPVPAETEESSAPPEAADAGADSDLERQVEEDLERVQELISTPEFVDDSQADLGAPETSAELTEPAPEDQDLLADDADTTTAEVDSPTAADEAIGEIFDQGDLTAAEEAAVLDPEIGELEDSPSLTEEGDEPPETSAPEADSPEAETSPDLPSAPPVEEPAATQPGDLVEQGPGVVGPQVLSFQPPAYSAVARRVGASGTVRVAVLVDENGQVLEARLVEGLRQRVGLDEQTLEAARRATFRPATKDGVPVRMWHELAVQFQP